MTTSRAVVDGSALPRHEAERLLMAAADRPRGDLVVGVTLNPDVVARFRELEARRLDGEPLQYLEGSVPFGPATIRVDERVLIPRPETEELYEVAAALVEAPSRILDLCTGSGNLAIALAMAHPGAEVFATDISSHAIDLAGENARSNGVAVRFGVGDLFDPLPIEMEGTFDLIVANPPYLAASEADDLPADVRREPIGALVSGPSGLETVARIAALAPRWLSSGAPIVCEVSEFHAARAAALFAPLGGVVRRDLFGKDRFVVGHAPVE